MKDHRRRRRRERRDSRERSEQQLQLQLYQHPQQQQYKQQRQLVHVPMTGPSNYDMRSETANTRPRASFSSSDSSSFSSSNTDSDLLDISRPSKFGFKSFFFGSSQLKHRPKHRVRKKPSTRIFRFGNSSSSSVNSDLAYGKGYIDRRRSRSPGLPSPTRSHRSRRYSGEKERGPASSRRGQTEDEKILELGRQFSELARQSDREEKKASGKYRTSALVGAATALSHYQKPRTGDRSERGLGSSKPHRDSHRNSSSDDSEWESDYSGDEPSSEDDSGLAYGVSHYVPPRHTRPPNHQSQQHHYHHNQQPAKYERSAHHKYSFVDPGLFGPVNSLRGIVNTPCGFDNNDRRPTGDRYGAPSIAPSENVSHNGRQLQQVYPIPTSDPARFDAGRSSIVSVTHDLVHSRPGPVPLQQPKPIAPVSSRVFDAVDSESKYSERSSSGKALAGVAMTGVAGAALARALVPDGKDDRDKHREERRDHERDHERDREKDLIRDLERDDRRRSKQLADEAAVEMERRRKSREYDARDNRHDKHGEMKKKDSDLDREHERKRRRHEKYRDDAYGHEQHQSRDRPADERTEERKSERRESRRAERREERRASQPPDIDTYRRVEDPNYPSSKGPIDPFQFQVADDAFQTPIYSSTPKRPLTPMVVTVDREPDFSRLESLADDIPPPVRLSRRDTYEQELREAEAHAHEARERSRNSVARPEPERGRSHFQGPDSSSQIRARPDSPQREANQWYRDLVHRRQVEQDRSRSASPEKSVVDKWKNDVKNGQKDDQRADHKPIIVEAAPLEENEEPKKKKKSLYDAPDADIRFDHEWTPKDLDLFETPNSPIKGRDLVWRDPSAERPRPMLNIVRPTPVQSPLPEKQKEKIESPRESRKDRQVDTHRSEPDVVISDVSEVAVTRPATPPKADSPRKSHKSHQVDIPKSEPHIVISKRGEEVVKTPATPKRVVSWGENETKHYIVDTSDDSSGAKVVTPAQNPKSRSSGKTSGWAILAAAIRPDSSNAAAPSTSDRSPPHKDHVHKDSESPRSREKSSRWPSSVLNEEVGISPPIPGPKPSSPRKPQMPGPFTEDPDFTATLAAGLQDTGFDPNIVINDSKYHTRDSPPGSNEPGPSYHSPFTETMRDLGIYTVGGPSHKAAPDHGFVIDETPATPADEKYISPDKPEIFSKLSKKESPTRDKSGQNDSFDKSQIVVIEDEPVESSRSVADHVYYGPKLSKKEQKRRDKAAAAAKARALQGEEVIEIKDLEPVAIEPVQAPVPDEREDFSPSKKKSKKGKNKAIIVQGDFQEPSSVPLPMDSPRDVQESRRVPNEDDWWAESPKKGKKKSERDSQFSEHSIVSEPSIISVPPVISAESSRSIKDIGTEPILDDESGLPKKGKKKSKRESIATDTPEWSTVTSGLSESSNRRHSMDDFSFVDAHEKVEDWDVPSSKKSKKKNGKKTKGDSTANDSSSQAPDRVIAESQATAESLSDLLSEKNTFPADIWEGPKKSKSKMKSKRDSRNASPTRSAPEEIPSEVPEEKSKKEKRPTTPGSFPEDESPGAVPDPADFLDRDPIEFLDRDRDVSTVVSNPQNGRKSRSKIDNQDDAKSVASSPGGSRRKDRKSEESKLEKDKEKRNSGGPGFFDRFRSSIGLVNEKDKDEKQSFLANAGTLEAAGVGLAGLAAPESQATSPMATGIPPEEKEVHSLLTTTPERRRSRSPGLGTIDPEIVPKREIRPAIDPQYGDLLPLPPSAPGSPTLEADDLPALPDSRPETPELERQMLRQMCDKPSHIRRKSANETPIKPKSPSQSAIPLAIRFKPGQRSPIPPSSSVFGQRSFTPSSPQMKSSPMASPMATPSSEQASASKTRMNRPTSWDNSKEFKPLYLVERKSRDSFAPPAGTDELLPALPPSEPPSRESPGQELQRRDNHVVYSQYAHARHLSKDLALQLDIPAAMHESNMSHLESQENTPKREAYTPRAGDDFWVTHPSEATPRQAGFDVIDFAFPHGPPSLKVQSTDEPLPSSNASVDSDRMKALGSPELTRRLSPAPIDPVSKDRSSDLISSSPTSIKSFDRMSNRSFDPTSTLSPDRASIKSTDEDFLVQKLPITSIDLGVTLESDPESEPPSKDSSALQTVAGLAAGAVAATTLLDREQVKPDISDLKDSSPLEPGILQEKSDSSLLKAIETPLPLDADTLEQEILQDSSDSPLLNVIGTPLPAEASLERGLLEETDNSLPKAIETPLPLDDALPLDKPEELSFCAPKKSKKGKKNKKGKPPEAPVEEAPAFAPIPSRDILPDQLESSSSRDLIVPISEPTVPQDQLGPSSNRDIIESVSAPESEIPQVQSESSVNRDLVESISEPKDPQDLLEPSSSLGLIKLVAESKVDGDDFGPASTSKKGKKKKKSLAWEPEPENVDTSVIEDSVSLLPSQDVRPAAESSQSPPETLPTQPELQPESTMASFRDMVFDRLSTQATDDTILSDLSQFTSQEDQCQEEKMEAPVFERSSSSPKKGKKNKKASKSFSWKPGDQEPVSTTSLTQETVDEPSGVVTRDDNSKQLVTSKEVVPPSLFDEHTDVVTGDDNSKSLDSKSDEAQTISKDVAPEPVLELKKMEIPSDEIQTVSSDSVPKPGLDESSGIMPANDSSEQLESRYDEIRTVSNDTAPQLGFDEPTGIAPTDGNSKQLNNISDEVQTSSNDVPESVMDPKQLESISDEIQTVSDIVPQSSLDEFSEIVPTDDNTEQLVRTSGEAQIVSSDVPESVTDSKVLESPSDDIQTVSKDVPEPVVGMKQSKSTSDEIETVPDVPQSDLDSQQLKSSSDEVQTVHNAPELDMGSKQLGSTSEEIQAFSNLPESDLDLMQPESTLRSDQMPSETSPSETVQGDSHQLDISSNEQSVLQESLPAPVAEESILAETNISDEPVVVTKKSKRKKKAKKQQVLEPEDGESMSRDQDLLSPPVAESSPSREIQSTGVSEAAPMLALADELTLKQEMDLSLRSPLEDAQHELLPPSAWLKDSMPDADQTSGVEAEAVVTAIGEPTLEQHVGRSQSTPLENSRSQPLPSGNLPKDSTPNEDHNTAIVGAGSAPTSMDESTLKQDINLPLSTPLEEGGSPSLPSADLPNDSRAPRSTAPHDLMKDDLDDSPSSATLDRHRSDDPVSDLPLSTSLAEARLEPRPSTDVPLDSISDTQSLASLDTINDWDDSPTSATLPQSKSDEPALAKNSYFNPALPRFSFSGFLFGRGKQTTGESSDPKLQPVTEESQSIKHTSDVESVLAESVPPEKPQETESSKHIPATLQNDKVIDSPDPTPTNPLENTALKDAAQVHLQSSGEQELQLDPNNMSQDPQLDPLDSSHHPSAQPAMTADNVVSSDDVAGQIKTDSGQDVDPSNKPSDLLQTSVGETGDEISNLQNVSQFQEPAPAIPSSKVNVLDELLSKSVDEGGQSTEVQADDLWAIPAKSSKKGKKGKKKSQQTSISDDIGGRSLALEESPTMPESGGSNERAGSEQIISVEPENVSSLANDKKSLEPELSVNKKKSKKEKKKRGSVQLDLDQTRSEVPSVKIEETPAISAEIVAPPTPTETSVDNTELHSIDERAPEQDIVDEAWPTSPKKFKEKKGKNLQSDKSDTSVSREIKEERASEISSNVIGDILGSELTDKSALLNTESQSQPPVTEKVSSSPLLESQSSDAATVPKDSLDQSSDVRRTISAELEISDDPKMELLTTKNDVQIPSDLLTSSQTDLDISRATVEHQDLVKIVPQSEIALSKELESTQLKSKDSLIDAHQDNALDLTMPTVVDESISQDMPLVPAENEFPVIAKKSKKDKKNRKSKILDLLESVSGPSKTREEVPDDAMESADIQQPTTMPIDEPQLEQSSSENLMSAEPDQSAVVEQKSLDENLPGISPKKSKKDKKKKRASQIQESDAIQTPADEPLLDRPPSPIIITETTDLGMSGLQESIEQPVPSQDQPTETLEEDLSLFSSKKSKKDKKKKRASQLQESEFTTQIPPDEPVTDGPAPEIKTEQLQMPDSELPLSQDQPTQPEPEPQEDDLTLFSSKNSKKDKKKKRASQLESSLPQDVASTELSLPSKPQSSSQVGLVDAPVSSDMPLGEVNVPAPSEIKDNDVLDSSRQIETSSTLDEQTLKTDQQVAPESQTSDELVQNSTIEQGSSQLPPAGQDDSLDLSMPKSKKDKKKKKRVSQIVLDEPTPIPTEDVSAQAPRSRTPELDQKLEVPSIAETSEPVVIDSSTSAPLVSPKEENAIDSKSGLLDTTSLPTISDTHDMPKEDESLDFMPTKKSKKEKKKKKASAWEPEPESEPVQIAGSLDESQVVHDMDRKLATENELGMTQENLPTQSIQGSIDEQQPTVDVTSGVDDQQISEKTTSGIVNLATSSMEPIVVEQREPQIGLDDSAQQIQEQPTSDTLHRPDQEIPLDESELFTSKKSKKDKKKNKRASQIRDDENLNLDVASTTPEVQTSTATAETALPVDSAPKESQLLVHDSISSVLDQQPEDELFVSKKQFKKDKRKAKKTAAFNTELGSEVIDTQKDIVDPVIPQAAESSSSQLSGTSVIDTSALGHQEQRLDIQTAPISLGTELPSESKDLSSNVLEQPDQSVLNSSLESEPTNQPSESSETEKTKTPEDETSRDLNGLEPTPVVSTQDPSQHLLDNRELGEISLIESPENASIVTRDYGKLPETVSLPADVSISAPLEEVNVIPPVSPKKSKKDKKKAKKAKSLSQSDVDNDGLDSQMLSQDTPVLGESMETMPSTEQISQEIPISSLPRDDISKLVNPEQISEPIPTSTLPAGQLSTLPNTEQISEEILTSTMPGNSLSTVPSHVAEKPSVVTEPEKQTEMRSEQTMDSQAPSPKELKDELSLFGPTKSDTNKKKGKGSSLLDYSEPTSDVQTPKFEDSSMSPRVEDTISSEPLQLEIGDETVSEEPTPSTPANEEGLDLTTKKSKKYKKKKGKSISQIDSESAFGVQIPATQEEKDLGRSQPPVESPLVQEKDVSEIPPTVESNDPLVNAMISDTVVDQPTPLDDELSSLSGKKSNTDEEKGKSITQVDLEPVSEVQTPLVQNTDLSESQQPTVEPSGPSVSDMPITNDPAPENIPTDDEMALFSPKKSSKKEKKNKNKTDGEWAPVIADVVVTNEPTPVASPEDEWPTSTTKRPHEDEETRKKSIIVHADSDEPTLGTQTLITQDTIPDDDWTTDMPASSVPSIPVVADPVPMEEPVTAAPVDDDLSGSGSLLAAKKSKRDKKRKDNSETSTLLEAVQSPTRQRAGQGKVTKLNQTQDQDKDIWDDDNFFKPNSSPARATENRPIPRSTTPTQEVSALIDVKLSPAQLNSHIDHERPFDQSTQPGKKVRMQSFLGDTVLPEPVSASPEIATSYVEDPAKMTHEPEPLESSSTSNNETDNLLQPKEMVVPEFDITPNREFAASYLESQPKTTTTTTTTTSEEVSGLGIEKNTLPAMTPRRELAASYFDPQPAVESISQESRPEMPVEISPRESRDNAKDITSQNDEKSAREIAVSILESRTSKKNNDVDTTTDVSEKSDESKNVGTGIMGAAAAGVAALAAKFGGSAITNRGKKQSKYVDKRTPKEDDIFDDASLWEGSERKTFNDGSRLDNDSGDFWDVPNEQMDEQDKPAEATARSSEENISDTHSKEQSLPQEKINTNSSSDSLESPVIGREELRGDLGLPGYMTKLESKEQETAKRTTPPASDLMTDLDQLDTSEPTQERSSDLNKPEGEVEDLSHNLHYQAPLPPASTYDMPHFGRLSTHSLPPVEEDPREDLGKDLEPRDVTGTPEVNRDSGFMTESPHPPRRSQVDDGQRDSGVHMRDWPENAPKRREGVSNLDETGSRLSPPKLDRQSQQESTPELEKRDTLQTPESKRLLRSTKYGNLGVATAAAAGALVGSPLSPVTTPLGHRSISDNISREGSPRLDRFIQPRRCASNTSISRLRTPEHLMIRPDSPGSNVSHVSLLSRSSRDVPTSTPTPPLRRVDKRMSGDLRSISQHGGSHSTSSLSKELAKQQEKTNSTPVANEGRVRAKDMTDVYDGLGEGRIGSPRSPTRPHSMRRRQSMQVLELESRVEHLMAENRMLADAKMQAESNSNLNQRAAVTITERDAQIESLRAEVGLLQREVSRLREVNDGLNSANAQLALQHASVSQDLEHRYQRRVQEKDAEIDELRRQLEATKEQVREIQRQMLASKPPDADFLRIKDEDHFDNRCQQLCSHVQQWVLRFSKFSDMRACRLTSEINDEKIIDRLDNSVLDGTDVDDYLSDRVRRRDIFMSMTMNMVWEFVFTRYLFGMDREQRQKLKSLEKLLSEVGPPHAVRQWRAVTLTLLSRRPQFGNQRNDDTEAVVQAILQSLSVILPPPSNMENQIQSQLRRVLREAVQLSIEMRTQKAEYMMLPPLQPEYDANGDLAETVTFNASLMHERSGGPVSNEELEAQGAVVRCVLFPLVVKKGDDNGIGDDEIVVCPAQVLVAQPRHRRMATPASDGAPVSRNATPSAFSAISKSVISAPLSPPTSQTGEARYIQGGI